MTMLFLIFLIPIVLFIVYAVRPMSIRRDPDSEGPQRGAAVIAYDRTAGWPIFKMERTVVLNELKKYNPGKIILDIGCGPGFLAARISRLFKDSDVIGLDISDEMITIAGRRWPGDTYPDLRFVLGDAGQMPFPDGSIDFIVSSLSTHHWSNPVTVFHEISRVLKPGGQFLIFDIRRDGPRFFYYSLKIGQDLFSPKAIKETNGAAGSFRASYIPSEFKEMLGKAIFKETTIDEHWGWIFVSGGK